MIRGSNHSGGKKFSYSPKRPARMWRPPSFLSNEYWGLPSPGVKGPGHETDPSPPPSADVTCLRGCSPAIRNVDIKKKLHFYFFATPKHPSQILWTSVLFVRFRTLSKPMAILTSPHGSRVGPATPRHWVNTAGSRSHQNNRPSSIQSEGERKIGIFRSKFTPDVPKTNFIRDMQQIRSPAT
jgi:hypothetical protein